MVIFPLFLQSAAYFTKSTQSNEIYDVIMKNNIKFFYITFDLCLLIQWKLSYETQNKLELVETKLIQTL